MRREGRAGLTSSGVGKTGYSAGQAQPAAVFSRCLAALHGAHGIDLRFQQVPGHAGTGIDEKRTLVDFSDLNRMGLRIEQHANPGRRIE